MKTLFIAGGSASGKSTLARMVKGALGEVTTLYQDSFYRDRPESSGAGDRHHFDFDQPDAIHWGEMRAALIELRAGRPVDVPVYDFTVSLRDGSERLVPRGDVLIVDGTLILHATDLRDLKDAAVYVAAPEALRRARRERRDREERGRDIADIRRQLANQVFPAHDEYVSPSRAHADLTLDAQAIMDDPDTAVSQVLALLRALP